MYTLNKCTAYETFVLKPFQHKVPCLFSLEVVQLLVLTNRYLHYR
uniref:Uncharacterized protein n=1 Tax=Anguilla anguilla TaxID=7936 RepID=A0A0E9WCS8_ANGAN